METCCWWQQTGLEDAQTKLKILSGHQVDIELVTSYIGGVAKESWLRRETLRSTRYTNKHEICK